jgi:hypothetical protein
MDKDTLIENVCRNYCRYYKPSKDEELACMGFLIIQRLLRNGAEIIFEESQAVLAPYTEETLVGNVCVTCPFFPDGCDFSLKREGSFPCGGFLVLGRLMEAGSISIDDIRNMD